jgi:hypothetical protein
MSALGLEVDRVHIGLIARMSRWGALVFVAATAGAALLDRHLAVGLGLGGGITLALFHLHRALAPALLNSPPRRRWRALFWLLWAVKLPVIGVILHFSFKAGLAAPVGVALGAGILPVVATVIAVRAALTDAFRRVPGARSR